jgi:hypothetical protein
MHQVEREGTGLPLIARALFLSICLSSASAAADEQPPVSDAPGAAPQPPRPATMHSEGAQSPNIQTLQGDLRYDNSRNTTNIILPREPLKPWTNYGRVVAWSAGAGLAASLLVYSYALVRQNDFDRARARYANGDIRVPAQEQIAWSKLEHDKEVVERAETVAVIGFGLSAGAALVALAFRLIEGSDNSHGERGDAARLELHF